MTWALTFLKTSSPAYREAVRMACEHPSYSERGGCEHALTFTTAPTDLGLLAELWRLVGRWKTTRLVIAGSPVIGRERMYLAEVLACAVQALRFTPPQRYCRANPGRESWLWPGRPPVPCRLFMARHAHALDQIEWTQPETATDAIMAALADVGVLRCPFLHLEPFERALAEWKARRAPEHPLRGQLGFRLAVDVSPVAETTPADGPLPPTPPIDEILRQIVKEAGPSGGSPQTE